MNLFALVEDLSTFRSAIALFINLYLIFVIEVAASPEYFDFPEPFRSY
jgi:hypothetical protein